MRALRLLTELEGATRPRSNADAKRDLDGDSLPNVLEYRLSGNPRDEDTDNDGQDDGDERTTRTKVNKADIDGDEDANRNGVANEDEDDTDTDACNGDRDGDGEDDEDKGDRFGTIESFDAATGTLVVTTVAGHRLSAQVTEETEIEFDDERRSGTSNAEDEGDEDEATLAALVAGVGIAELELDRKTGAVEEIELHRAGPRAHCDARVDPHRVFTP